MSCPSSELLSRFVADGLDPDITAHLATCDSCSAEVEAHRAVTADVRLVPAYEPSPAHLRDVRAALLAAARIPAPAPVISLASRRTILVAGAVLAAAAIALLMIKQFGSHDVTAVYRGTIHPHDGAQFIRVGGSPDEIVRLTRGTITVEVAALEPKERFRVITDDSEVEVRGTAFDVTAANDHLVAVHVLHGKVEVHPVGSQAVFLGEGQRWQPTLARTDEVLPGPGSAAPKVAAAGTNAPSTDDTDASGDARDTDATKNADTTRNTTTDLGVAPRVIRNSVASGESGAHAASEGHSAKTVAIADDTGKSSRATTKSVTNVSEIANSPAELSNTEASASGSASTGVSPVSTVPTTSASKTTQQIIVSQVPPPTTSKRPNEVEFDKGWQAMNGGNFSGAATSFEQAAKAAPNDPLAEDAWFWRASALTRAKSSSAASALDAFIARYPHSPRAGEASAMLGWLLLDRDTDRAEKLFTAASNDRVDAVAASGKKGLAAVAQKRANAN